MSTKGGIVLLSLLSTCLAAPSASVLAQGQGRGGEKVWMHGGKINRIDKTGHKIVVNDLSFKIIPESRLVSADGQQTIVTNLEAGQVAGVDYRKQSGLGRVVEALKLFRGGQKPRLETGE